MSDQLVRLLVVDDHLIVREGLRLILETVSEIDLVGEAGDGNEALSMVDALDPDVVLMDLRMPGMDGITAIEMLSDKGSRAAVIILTTYDEDDLMVRGLQAGARGYLLKDTDRTTLIDSIMAAARGETLLTPEVLERLLSHTSMPSSARERRRGTDLTPREFEILEGVARGERNKEIAARLGITERTVKAHLTSIFNKFGVDSRAAAIAVAAQRGLL